MPFYKKVIVRSVEVCYDKFDSNILAKVSSLQKTTGIKGGFAREMLKVALGVSNSCNRQKTQDLDIAVFEKPMSSKTDRIVRRDSLVRALEHVEPKDLEFIDEGIAGLKHYFLTRDVSMNEVLVLGTDKNCFQVLYTEQCIQDLKDRVVRPSVHCAHSGLGQVWTLLDNKEVIHPNIVRRCVYRYTKDDGDSYNFGEFKKEDSVAMFNDEELFKLIKRFIGHQYLFDRCCCALLDFGFNKQAVSRIQEQALHFCSTSLRHNLSSAEVENVLERYRAEYHAWRTLNTSDRFVEKADIVFLCKAPQII